jgi:hypothetical protein
MMLIPFSFLFFSFFFFFFFFAAYIIKDCMLFLYLQGIASSRYSPQNPYEVKWLCSVFEQAHWQSHSFVILYFTACTCLPSFPTMDYGGCLLLLLSRVTWCIVFCFEKLIALG